MGRLLRFCMVTSFYPPYNFGGDGVYVHALSNELARRGHQVHVIHCQDAFRAFAQQDPVGAYHDHPNVTVHGLHSPFGILSPLLTHQTGLPLLKSAAIQRILDQGFDVIHFHTVSLVGGPGILSYGRGIKLYSAHDHWLVCPTRELFRFGRSVCTARRCFLCSLVHKRPPQLWRYTRLLRTAVKHVDGFIMGSRFSMQKHRELGLDVPMVHLPHFVAEDEQPPAAGRASIAAPFEPYFLFVGRLVKNKGLQTLIPLFRNRWQAHLLVAGSGRYEPQLRRMAEGCANIHFLGQVGREQLPSLYRNAVALLVPSIAYEVGPLVIIEAFQQRTPVIVRNLGGMPEYAQESSGGLIYDTEEELVAAMERLLEDPSYRRELGFRGYRAYLEKWTPEAHVKQYLALIDGIAANLTVWAAGDWVGD
jgi:glycosyltransferase involved in cell wall biosynthesis